MSSVCACASPPVSLARVRVCVCACARARAHRHTHVSARICTLSQHIPATSSIELMDIVERVKGTPNSSAACAAAISPSLHIIPPKPHGASARGIATGCTCRTPHPRTHTAHTAHTQHTHTHTHTHTTQYARRVERGVQGHARGQHPAQYLAKHRRPDAALLDIDEHLLPEEHAGQIALVRLPSRQRRWPSAASTPPPRRAGSARRPEPRPHTW